MEVTVAKRPKGRQDENARLKRLLLADAMLDNAVLRISWEIGKRPPRRLGGSAPCRQLDHSAGFGPNSILSAA